MAGIYIHIPFCRRACHYCDFHFSTNLARSSELVDAIVSEVGKRKDHVAAEPIRTIYFGGGTPSLLPTGSLNSILSEIDQHHTIEKDAEMTLEANPEDLSRQKLEELRSIGINRLSLGTQSFIDAELKWMNRMHTAKQAEECIGIAQQIGFDNISIDLIFGLPEQTETDWQYNLDKAISLGVQHISSYALTVEDGTILSRRIQKGAEKMPNENKAAHFFEMNMDLLPKHGFEQYEISNFAQEGFISEHNSSYWKTSNYIGLGPSAHSFNGTSRQWNVRSNAGYISKLNKDETYFEKEELSVKDRLNEHLLTGIRTKWGVEKRAMEDIEKGSWNLMISRITKADEPCFQQTDSRLTLTRKGKLMADRLSSDLFF